MTPGGSGLSSHGGDPDSPDARTPSPAVPHAIGGNLARHVYVTRQRRAEGFVVPGGQVYLEITAVKGEADPLAWSCPRTRPARARAR